MPGLVGQIKGSAPQIGVYLVAARVWHTFQSEFQQISVVAFQFTQLVVGQAKAILLNQIAKVNKGFSEVGVNELSDDAFVKIGGFSYSHVIDVVLTKVHHFFRPHRWSSLEMM